MIYDILKIIKESTSNFLETASEDASEVVLENIAKLDEAKKSDVEDKMILTLLNSQEEATLKNKPLTKISTGPNTYKTEAIPAYLNLYIMLASNRTNYEKALQDISLVIAFFQNKPVFTELNTPDHTTGLAGFKFIVDLYSLPIEQLSYAWGVLGGKVLPSAMYKVSVLKVQLSDADNDEQTLIKGVVSKFKDYEKGYKKDDVYDENVVVGDV